MTSRRTIAHTSCRTVNATSDEATYFIKFLTVSFFSRSTQLDFS